MSYYSIEPLNKFAVPSVILVVDGYFPPLKLENKIALLESKVATAKLAVRKSIDDDSITLKTRSSTEEILEEIKIKKQELERLNLERENTVMAEEAFFPRYWNQDYIRRNREDCIGKIL